MLMYAKITIEHSNSLILPVDEITTLFSSASTGDKYEVEFIEMEKEEFDSLPEFQGF